LTIVPQQDSIPVLCDTDVFSRVFVQSRSDTTSEAWSNILEGRTIAVAFQTEAELRAWPLLSKWGKTKTDRLIERVEAVARVPANQLVLEEYVKLAVWAKENGAAIFQKVHTGDCWIAATAIAYDLELAAIDGIYDDIARLRLLKPSL
jgi:predicted nucleic acid-binding protein